MFSWIVTSDPTVPDDELELELELEEDELEEELELEDDELEEELDEDEVLPPPPEHVGSWKFPL